MNQTDALRLIESWLERRASPRNLIAIAGGTCSGKTFFSQAICRHFGEADVSLVQLDDYFKDINDPTLPIDEEGFPLFDAPKSHHDAEFIQDIGFLLSGSSIWTPLYDMATNRRLSANGSLVKPKKIIVAEGLHALYLLNRLDTNFRPLNIYVDVPDNVRLGRRIARDTSTYGVPYKLVVSAFYDRLLPLHQRYVEPQKAKAHIIVEGTNG